ncbi:hypothetical protein OPV22_000648 [Ensete ventricosum]|uniref:LOB domain-containing protein n=1 Tax=Ensete ventricosum TaxID=4639 RepID=A0AAV8RJK2_ENSVE|nr:hypothetical protein OPV22_000648 [Ensete ventricosum]
MERSKTHERVGVPRGLGTDSDDGFGLRRMRRSKDRLGDPREHASCLVSISFNTALYLRIQAATSDIEEQLFYLQARARDALVFSFRAEVITIVHSISTHQEECHQSAEEIASNSMLNYGLIGVSTFYSTNHNPCTAFQGTRGPGINGLSQSWKEADCEV